MLRSVEIQNFGSCSRTSFEIDTSLAALCGPNGVGKSTVLKAIAWVCSGAVTAEPLRLPHEFRRHPEPAKVEMGLRFDLQGVRYRYFLSAPQTRVTPRWPSIAETLVAGEDGDSISIFDRRDEAVDVMGRRDRIRIAKSTPGLAALTALLPDDDPVGVHLARVRSFFAGVRYYPFEDDSAANIFASEDECEEWKDLYVTGGEPTPSLVMSLLYMHREEPDLFGELKFLLGPKGLGVVESIEVFDQVFDPASIAGGPYDPPLDSKLSTVIARPSRHMGGTETAFRLSQLSLGARRIIQIVTSMLLDRRSLMLMEQPEDSIHPGLLRKLVSLLRTYSGDTQMLFTTHSPAVLDILRPEEVLLATASEGATEVRRLTQDEMESAKEFLEMDGPLSEFLEAQDDL